MIDIDGSEGEGGGQILRSSLALSLVTRRAVRICRIRENRPEPGLRAQHLAAVRAAAKVGSAKIEGVAIGSRRLVFEPARSSPGDYRFEIGTAGAASLVLQTVFVPLSFAGAASTVAIEGGTHVPWSPSFDYLREAWLPSMREIGFDADADLALAGFYPKGGGRLDARVRPAGSVRPLTRLDRGSLVRIRGSSAVANLDDSIAERQRRAAVDHLGRRCADLQVRVERLPSRAQGTSLVLVAEFERARLVSTALGRLGKRAEEVGREAAVELGRMLDSEGAVDPHLADQLVLPLAFGEGRSEFRVCESTQHLRTNLEVVRKFLPEVRAE
ncbi:MAG TPA: RNA 3'-terminal phosphate cyclase, partial [Planctomycetota bacterium]|nr:RNA 3'-terminal phosphate cyclase [Planctomycetota bacterium]